MNTMLFHAVQVTVMQVLLFVIVPAWTLVRWRWRDASEFFFAALLAGAGSAALLGRVCDGTGIGAGAALGIWLAGWIVAGILARRKKPGAEFPRLDWILLAMLFLAWAVRIIHPLQTWALGQSDAYSHLGFLTDVLQRGRVGNPEYPPAYSWVLAFPAWLLQGHPYWVARFGGAFFGAGLALGVCALAAQMRGRTAGLAGAALVAGCPAFFLLQKTGVGCFANQLGLILIPAALWAYASGRRGWLALALTALAVSVPMMLLHVVILLAILVLLDREAGRSRFAWLALLLLAFLLVLGIALCRPVAHGLKTAWALTGSLDLTRQPGSGWGIVLRTLAADFFSFKRMGYASGLLNDLALAATAVFALALIGGWRRRDAAWRLVGAWGLLASVNVHFGLLQFTNYQREGWSLLTAAAVLGGLVFEALWRRWNSRRGQRLLGAGLALAALAGLALPPTHLITSGPAESELVRYLLALDPAVTVLARDRAAFDSDQGDLVRTLHPNFVNSPRELAAAIKPVYFLRDHPPRTPVVSRIMQILQPALTTVNELAMKRAEAENRHLEVMLAKYEQYRVCVSPHLEVWQVWREPLE